jgi:hypothetical protein
MNLRTAVDVMSSVHSGMIQAENPSTHAGMIDFSQLLFSPDRC